MRRLRHVLNSPPVMCALWIFVCFSLTSAAWISWEYNLMTLVKPDVSDIYTMVIGYLLQAAGAGLTVCALRSRPTLQPRKTALAALCAFLLVMTPALLSKQVIAVIITGLLLNLLCGIIAGLYLYAAAVKTPAEKRGLVFGGGYGASTIFVFLLSLAGKGSFLRNGSVLFIYLLLAGAAIWLSWMLLRGVDTAADQSSSARQPLPRQTWMIALVCIFLMSLVKNMGFSFPSADFSAGISVELSRVFYALGLVIAGIVNDRSRKLGAVCTAAALAMPFAMLALADEKVPGLIFWGLDYLFFGFFSVYRVVLTMDMAEQTNLWHLAPLGLLAGRLGDAAGTALCMGLGGERLALVLLTLALFILTVLLFFRLYQALYLPEALQERSEREIFEDFAIQHDLSAREKEVLRLLLAEQPNNQIAETLFVSESTIKYHVHNLLQKTGCKTRQELVRRYNMLLYPQISGSAASANSRNG